MLPSKYSISHHALQHFKNIVLLFDILLTGTHVRVKIASEQKFDIGRMHIMMSGWTFFFVLIGVVFLTAQLFRVIDAIKRPVRHSRHRSAVR